MNVGGLAKGALIGALLGGAFNGLRQFRAQKSDRPPLPARHDNLAQADEDLVQLLQELADMAHVPAASKPAFKTRLCSAIGLMERVAAIELQIEKQEIVPGFHDANDAAQLAHSAVQELRAIEQLFDQLELRMQFRDKVAEVQTRLGVHLNNINSECLQY